MRPVKMVWSRFIRTLNPAPPGRVLMPFGSDPAIPACPPALDRRVSAAALSVDDPASPRCPVPASNPAQRPLIGRLPRGFRGSVVRTPPESAMFDLCKPLPVVCGGRLRERENRRGRSGCGRTGGYFSGVRAVGRGAASWCKACALLSPGNCAISGAHIYPEYKIHARPLRAKQKRRRCGQPGSSKEKPRPHRGRGQNLERLRKD